VAASLPDVELGGGDALQAAEKELMKAEGYARVLASAGKHRLLARLVYSVEMAARACGLPGGSTCTRPTPRAGGHHRAPFPARACGGVHDAARERAACAGPRQGLL